MLVCSATPCPYTHTHRSEATLTGCALRLLGSLEVLIPSKKALPPWPQAHLQGVTVSVLVPQAACGQVGHQDQYLGKSGLGSVQASELGMNADEGDLQCKL
jgi:hypothetical protein